MKATVLIGRILFSLIFLTAAMGHFSEQGIGYAASQGVPLPYVLVPLSGIFAVLGALSIIIGFKAKIGAWHIILFMVPVTFMMHKFWTFTDPMQMQIQMSMFIKNLSILGAALLITYFGAGPLSVDAKTTVVKSNV